MKAVVFERPGQITLTSLADPTPGSSDVILKVEASGICGTDLHLLNGDISSAHYPVVPGHEFCGRWLRSAATSKMFAWPTLSRSIPISRMGRAISAGWAAPISARTTAHSV